MAFPSAAQTELAILRALYEAGGEAMPADSSFYQLIALYFPEIDMAEWRETDPETGKNRWAVQCQQQFRRMLRRGEVENIAGDTLALSAAGRARLEKEWPPEWGPPPF